MAALEFGVATYSFAVSALQSAGYMTKLAQGQCE